MKNTRAVIASCLFIVSLTLLIPGLIYPLITIKARVDKSELIDIGVKSFTQSLPPGSFTSKLANTMMAQLDISGSIQVFEKTRSILGTIDDLVSSGHFFVAILIGLFAVVVPAIKIALLTFAFILPQPRLKSRLGGVSGVISKWSMTDVFVMAIIVGFMAVNATPSAREAFEMSAQLGSGFYFFSAYCLLSIASAQLMEGVFNRRGETI